MRSSLAPRMETTYEPAEIALLAAALPQKSAAALKSADVAPYMSLVHEEVRRILRRLPSSVQKDDLISVGAMGLMSALQKNQEADRGAQFEWYARIRIRGAVLDELRNQDWLSPTAPAEVRAQAETHQRA